MTQINDHGQQFTYQTQGHPYGSLFQPPAPQHAHQDPARAAWSQQPQDWYPQTQFMPAAELYGSDQNAYVGSPMPLPSEQVAPNRKPSAPAARMAVIAAMALLILGLAVGGFLLLHRGQPTPVSNPGPFVAPPTSAPVITTPRVETPTKPVVAPVVPVVPVVDPTPTVPATQQIRPTLPTAPITPVANPTVDPNTNPAVDPNTNPAVTGTAWPAAYSPFSALVGHAPGDGAAWGGSTCSYVTNDGSLPGAIDAVACKTTTGLEFTVVQFQSPSSVQSIVSHATATGANVRGWTKSGSQQAGESVEVSSSTGSELVTTFDDLPTMILDLNTMSPMSSLEAWWITAPLPA